LATAILLGIPARYVKTARSAVESSPGAFDHWSIKFIECPEKEPQISPREVKRALTLASEQPDAHILGFSVQRNRQDFANQIRSYFRFRWFDHGLLRFLGSPDPSPFVKQFAADLAEEGAWLDRVKPSALDSPLLLPECSFEVVGKHRDLWRHVCSYGDPGNIEGAEKAIQAFWNFYRRRIDFGGAKQSKWIDRGDRIFNENGERHGIAPFPRGWKYSYRIQDGFHFDVTCYAQRPFFVYDALGGRTRVHSGEHINLDPHGYVR
jgi:hypothetical protein